MENIYITGIMVKLDLGAYFQRIKELAFGEIMIGMEILSSKNPIIK